VLSVEGVDLERDNASCGYIHCVFGGSKCVVQETARFGRRVTTLRSVFAGGGLGMGVATCLYTTQSKSVGDCYSMLLQQNISG
jgi:hypothetical protein